MKEKLEQLIEALREELQHYGEMLALLDQQQDLVVRRAADDLLNCVAAVNAQSTAIQTARKNRENCHRTLNLELRLPKETALADLVPRLPEARRPLVAALFQENNSLLTRVQQRARQNQVLLSHSVELMQRFINSLLPLGRATTYKEDGSVPAAAVSGSALLEAVG